MDCGIFPKKFVKFPHFLLCVKARTHPIERGLELLEGDLVLVTEVPLDEVLELAVFEESEA